MSDGKGLCRRTETVMDWWGEGDKGFEVMEPLKAPTSISFHQYQTPTPTIGFVSVVDGG